MHNSNDEFLYAVIDVHGLEGHMAILGLYSTSEEANEAVAWEQTDMIHPEYIKVRKIPMNRHLEIIGIQAIND